VVHGGRRDVDLDSAGAIDSLQKVIWDRGREKGCRGRVPGGALEVVWEPFLDLQGFKNGPLEGSSGDFAQIVAINRSPMCFLNFSKHK